MPMMQQERLVEVASPLGPDALLFRSMTASETLGRPYEMSLELYSEDHAIVIDDVLGESLCVRLTCENGRPRYFHGVVTEFSQVETSSTRYAAYTATLRPWFWLLTRTSDCRYFRGTVPDIAKEIFGEFGFADFESRLQGTYQSWDYCVQYRETAFNFLSRLFEQEGIYYYFEHSQQKHTMILCDGYASHRRIPGYGTIPYYPRDPGRQREREHVYGWRLTRRVRPGLYVQRDFNFETPKANMLAEAAKPREHANASFEVFDYPGEYDKKSEGDSYAKVRMEELQVDHQEVDGEADTRGLQTGALFELSGFPREDQNREYLVASSTVRVSSNQYESSESEGGTDHSISFTSIDAKETYRPPRLTPKPLISGPQTAVVVGKAGKEIWTDKYGRVRVQFHWDRRGKFDENSAWWVRVSQAWAGKQWGAFYVPRVGQEVIVEFLEGDPDLPIITGRVYNGDNMPPYPLPGRDTVSTIKSKSSPGGAATAANEIRFEDKKGAEQFFLQAERNFDLRVKKDAFRTIEGERHLQVLKSDYQQVDLDRHITVKGDHVEKVTGTASHVVGMDQQDKVGMSYAMQAGMDVHIKAGMNVVIEAGMQVTLKAGGGFITVGPTGVVISGMPVMINSGGAPGAGAGSSPDSPKAAKPADKGTESGKEQVPTKGPPPKKPKQYSPQALALKSRAASGTPFCAICS